MSYLTKIEIQQIKKSLKELFNGTNIKISSYESNGFGSGYNNSNGKWGDFYEYKGVIKITNEYDLNKYPFGNISEGDMVILIPANTNLSVADKYKALYGGREFIIESNRVPYTVQGETLYYILHGSR